MFADDMTGPITAISGDFSSDMVSSGTITVFDQTIVVDGNTVFEPSDLRT